MNKIIKYFFRAVPYLIYKYPRILYLSKHKYNYPKVYKYQQIQHITDEILRRTDVELIVDGKENIMEKSSYMLAPNHQALLDAVAMISVIDDTTAYVAKKETTKMPIVGTIIDALESKFLDRGNIRAEVQTMKEIRISMQTQNLKWCIFPEGTRTRNENHALNEFKPGAFKSAKTAQLDIYPIAIWGTYRILNKSVKNLKKYPVYISILPPLKAEDVINTNTVKIASFVKSSIEKRIEELKILDQNNIEKYLKK